MKKNFLSLLILIGLIGLTSCKKEQQTGIVFNATMEDCTDVRGSKTVLNGEALHWTAEDRVRIYGEGWGDFAVTPLTPATDARFTALEGGSLGQSASYRAYYPATLTTDGIHVTLPATQTSTDGSLREYPMYAESATEKLGFKNLCGVLKLNLQKDYTTITSIRLTMGSAINGTYTVSYSGGVPSLSLQSDGGNTTTLECSQSIHTAHDFYIYLPEGTYSGLTLEITAENGDVCTKGPATGSVAIMRSQYSTLTLGGDDLTFVPPVSGLLPGLFSVSATKQVRFSQGNLQRSRAAGFRLAEHQYDFVGNATVGNVYKDGEKCDNSRYNNESYTGWVDLFPITYGISIPMGGDWHTLYKSEWEYLLNNRTDAGDKYGTGTVCGIPGLILLPDNWTLPTGSVFNAGFDSSGSDWSRNTYSSEQWAPMEAAGAVFLPAAGMLDSEDGRLYYLGDVRIGCYWLYYANFDEYSDYPDGGGSGNNNTLEFEGSDVNLLGYYNPSIFYMSLRPVRDR